MAFTINKVYVMGVVNTKPQFIIRVEIIVIGIVQRRETNNGICNVYV